MSGSSAKETRRELRRSMGEAATNAVAEMQKNIASLANSLALAHKRIDDLQASVKDIDWRAE